MRVFDTLDDFIPCVGQQLAVSEWMTVTQDRIDTFAEATEDDQWIHVDRERAAAGPYGGTIAHGLLTLSLLPRMFATAIKIGQYRMGLNYGFNKVRFPAPVPVNSRVRARIALAACEPVADDGLQFTFVMEIEREGSDKPVCVAEFLQRRYR